MNAWRQNRLKVFTRGGVRAKRDVPFEHDTHDAICFQIGTNYLQMVGSGCEAAEIRFISITPFRCPTKEIAYLIKEIQNLKSVLSKY